ncbi:hypothetical protein C5167_021346 [Papaver somniferum]|uniref:Cation efflux protein cytoplasmic domain-containing protein n=1 Tax=Papaver somniferum TaxID=3469 RepID=A0A4Y7IZJ4_PAPSO|nr:hypothetical protein C5167_021346 [Papaver somniferum]
MVTREKAGWKATPRYTYGFFRIEILGALVSVLITWIVTVILCYKVIDRIIHGTEGHDVHGWIMVLIGSLESVPSHIDSAKLARDLCETVNGVDAVHQLHIWSITSGEVILSCHLRVNPHANPYIVLKKVIQHVKQEYKISNVTVQVELSEDVSQGSRVFHAPEFDAMFVFTFRSYYPAVHI